MARLDKELFNYESHSVKDGVLINKFGIDDSESLDKIERIITNAKLATLYMEPVKGNFDVKHYLSIHKYLFEDIYDFAGEIRSEVINKNIPFCLPQNIYTFLKNTLEDAWNNHKRINNRDDLVKFITILYGDLDIIHPFREGNGRCEREFIRQYIKYISKVRNLGDYNIDYSLITNNEEFINAVIKADMCNYTDLYNIINNIIVDNKENDLNDKNSRKR